MSCESETRSPFLRFLDSFLQDRNIVWMLGIGTAIFVGSSLFLVARHWAEATPLWKYGILLSYTCGVYGAGEFARRRLALRRTSTVLQALTIVLLPITFVALRWVEPADAALLPTVIGRMSWFGLCAANLLVSQWISRRVFAQFLRGDQPTFVCSYLLLSLAGAVVPEVAQQSSSALAACAAFALWVIFTLSTVKVNRHVFWLTEEHRLPRVFGFFPVVLLGSQFLLLFSACLAAKIEWPWIGLGCELVAVTVLLTADAVARVHEQRTGGLIRPWPWSLVVPFLVGLGFAASGVVLAATQLPAPPRALVPAAALAALIAGVTARRVRSVALVWSMLAAVVVAYNFSPSYFQDLARAVVRSGAEAVREPKLPYPLYGLTYLPLLIALTSVAVWRRNRDDELFVRQIRRFAVGLATLLLIVSLGHVKAMFLVPVALTAFFAGQVVAFRDRKLMIPAIAAFILAAAGFTPFVSGVLLCSVPDGFPTFCLGLAAAMLLWPGAALDRVRFSPLALAGGEARGVRGERLVPFCQLASVWLTLALLGWWTVQRFRWQDFTEFRIADEMLAAFLFVQAARWIRRGLGELAFGFAGVVGLLHAIRIDLPLPDILSWATFYGLGLWVIAWGLERRPHLRLAQAFTKPALHVSVALLITLIAEHHFPMLARAMAGGDVIVTWSSAALIVVWAFDAAWRLRSQTMTVGGALLSLLLIGAGLTRTVGIEVASDWLPAAWATSVGVAIPILSHGRMLTDDVQRKIVQPLRIVVLVVLAGAGVASWVWFGLPQRLASAVVIASLVWLARVESTVTLRRVAALFANWLVLSLVMQVTAPEASSVFDLTLPDPRVVALPLAAAAAISVAIWQRGRSNFAVVQRTLLRIVAASCLAGVLTLFAAGLSLAQTALVVIACGTLAGVELWSASRDEDELRVWWAEVIVGIAVGYLAAFGVIELGRGLAMWAVLGCGLLLSLFGHVAGRESRTAICSRPFCLTGLYLPLVSVGLGLYRHFAYEQPAWRGANTLALLIAAGYYFWRGLERGEKRWVVTSAAIVDFALALLWRELAWSDPQLFLVPVGLSILGVVELLKSEIPRPALTPLRYLGALVILASPMFDIVAGSWAHILSLMVSSVVVTLLAMGLRVRALMYTGTAFLVADLVAMLVHGSLRHPDVLWIAGIGLGAAVLALAAFCENHRELLAQRLRVLAAELEAWE